MRKIVGWPKPSLLSILLVLAVLVVTGIYFEALQEPIESGQFSASVIEQDQEIDEFSELDVAGYSFDVPDNWEMETIFKSSSSDQLQFRNKDGEIMMNVACPWLETDYSIWNLEDSQERGIQFEDQDYQVSYKYYVPKQNFVDADSVVLIEMTGGQRDCQINAQSVENRLDNLKEIYESIRIVNGNS